VTDARYVNALKLFLQGVTPLEYTPTAASPMWGGSSRAPVPRVAGQMQSIDEMRHNQTETHAISHYNKYFNGGFHNYPNHMHDRCGTCRCRSRSSTMPTPAGPVRVPHRIGFSFEYVLTNLLFVPFMSGAAHNGDMPP
jgi:phenol hydroxylase P3 protein